MVVFQQRAPVAVLLYQRLYRHYQQGQQTQYAKPNNRVQGELEFAWVQQPQYKRNNTEQLDKYAGSNTKAAQNGLSFSSNTKAKVIKPAISILVWLLLSEMPISSSRNNSRRLKRVLSNPSFLMAAIKTTTFSRSNNSKPTISGK